MIITRLVGGLGNQMFEYAAGYAVAKENNAKLGIDISWFAERNSVVWTMGYALDCFNITAKQTRPDQYKVLEKLGKLPQLTGLKVIEYKENSLRFDPNVFKAGKHVVMDGYWQSQKYFIKHREHILQELSFRDTPSEKNTELYRQINQTNAVSLHVRRGDYANHAQTNATHGLMTLDYYQRAIDSLKARMPDIHLFVFSDEPEWCEKNLALNVPRTFISGNIGHEDMQLMAACKHHVIANSSFSWWGAWLNPSQEKIVVAPKKWFNDTSLDSTDLVPETWERI